MPDDPIQESISCLIVKVARAHRTLAATLLAELDLYPGQEFLLMQLWREDGLPQSEPPTLTKMLHRLEGCGVVERKRDPVDARVCRVHLTDRGYALREPVEQFWQTLELTTLANLSLEEKLLLRRLLLQLAQNLA
jgi:MarR family transcriptional regulator, organic hydroperoxide resistance regulator